MIAKLQDVVEAIEKRQLVPCFQPLVEIRSGLLTGFEMLARWNHPVHGLILPSNFISLAEEHDLIDEVMDQIFLAAFQAAKSIETPHTLSVNLSPIQFQNRSLPDHIFRMAEQTGYSLHHLVVEITESALLDDLGCAREIALDLKSLGCRLALDDFGTGYSSLSHLQALPFDELKIDRSFVASMASRRESRKIVAAVIGLGHSLGLKTIAEGIETEEQAAMLLCLGCEVGQGWLYGKPVQALDLSSALAAPPRPTAAAPTPCGDGLSVSSLEALPNEHLAQLQAIYEGAPVGLCFLDRNLRYVNLNHRLAAIHNISVAAHLGRTMQEVVPQLFELVEPSLLRSLKGEAVARIAIIQPATGPSETEKYLLLSCQPVRDEAGEVIGISVAVVDVMEYKTPFEQPPTALPLDFSPNGEILRWDGIVEGIGTPPNQQTDGKRSDAVLYTITPPSLTKPALA
jgi:EAL domain-containing protein (putative c-di-GMP-specific phosphodiesterase class I)